MRLTIFSRLMMGYLAIFALVIAVIVYAVFQLRQFNKTARYILIVDNRILDYEKKLSDSILSQLRYEKKYFITRDRTRYDQFLSARDEFKTFLSEVRLIADTASKRESLDRIRGHHESYEALVTKEAAHVKSNRLYPKKEYDQEKEKIVDDILRELESLQQSARRDSYDRMKTLGESGITARKVAFGIGAVVFILVIGISFFITRSITRPLNLLRAKTKEISGGVFNGNLSVSSPPEILELTKAFNLMCDKLNTVDRMKSDFFSMMSHELRTPLTSIKEGTALLKEGAAGSITDQQARLLRIIAEESQRLIGLVNSLLDLSKMEAGMMTYAFEKGTLSPLIDKAVTEMVPLIETKKIRLEKQIEEGLPKIRIDVERILQALRNLIGNAVKFTPEGGRVQVFVRRAKQGVEVSVADTGPGIPQENLSTIFDKFQQASPAGAYHIKGTGLGLAIVKHIISSHGGKIWAQSEPGQGSTFVFVLPS